MSSMRSRYNSTYNKSAVYFLLILDEGHDPKHNTIEDAFVGFDFGGVMGTEKQGVGGSLCEYIEYVVNDRQLVLLAGLSRLLE